MNPSQQTRTRNREMCERILRRWDRTLAPTLEPLRESKLSNTPFDVLEALAWAYGEIDRLERE